MNYDHHWHLLLISDNLDDSQRIETSFASVQQVAVELSQLSLLNPDYETILRPDIDFILVDYPEAYSKNALRILEQAIVLNVSAPIFFITDQVDYWLDKIPINKGAVDLLPKGQITGILLYRLFTLAASQAENNTAVRAAFRIAAQRLDAMRNANLQLQEEIKKREILQSELKEKNEELDKFASIISHDLQEPLRMISGYLQLLTNRYKGALGKDADLFIAHAVGGTQRMRQLIQDLLAYSRLGSRNAPLQKTNLNEVLHKVLANLALQIEETGVNIYAERLPQIQAEPMQMLQLFQNLLSNALKFRSERPLSITISVNETPHAIQISVSDNGIGMDMTHAQDIFDIFRRLHSRQAYDGTGIGLSICQRVVENHGGTIWVESELNVGTTFFFTFPLLNQLLLTSADLEIAQG